MTLEISIGSDYASRYHLGRISVKEEGRTMHMHDESSMNKMLTVDS
jgi:hypothetical protein